MARSLLLSTFYILAAFCRLSSTFLPMGGGENRTPVLHKIFRGAYVRSPSIDVSSHWPTGRPLLDEPSMLSGARRRRTGALTRICDTPMDAPGGLPQEHCWCN